MSTCRKRVTTVYNFLAKIKTYVTLNTLLNRMPKYREYPKNVIQCDQILTVNDP